MPQDPDYVLARVTGSGEHRGAQKAPLSLQKLLDDHKITIALDAKARDWLAEKDYNPAYGARPLKRVIQKSVQDPLAEMILAGACVTAHT